MRHLLSILFLLQLAAGSHAQFSAGYYIDSNGNKIGGLLRSTSVSSFKQNTEGSYRLYYKKDSASKAVKFNALQIKGFVIGSDSFTVIRNLRLTAFITCAVDFCKVLEIGPVKLFEYDAEMMTSTVMRGFSSDDISYWIVEKDHKGVLLSPHNFKEAMEKMMPDDAGLIEKIKSKEFKYKDTREVVRAYNQYRATSR